mmetsp:Transcript_5455/g.16226  ORF Transcript_5455/g.16226 Transcript_5455/m.16226 type:complete len:313 (-) Transcript_5455:12-950(-)
MRCPADHLASPHGRYGEGAGGGTHAHGHAVGDDLEAALHVSLPRALGSIPCRLERGLLLHTPVPLVDLFVPRESKTALLDIHALGPGRCRAGVVDAGGRWCLRPAVSLRLRDAKPVHPLWHAIGQDRQTDVEAVTCFSLVLLVVADGPVVVHAAIIRAAKAMLVKGAGVAAVGIEAAVPVLLDQDLEALMVRVTDHHDKVKTPPGWIPVHRADVKVVPRADNAVPADLGLARLELLEAAGKKDLTFVLARYCHHPSSSSSSSHQGAFLAGVAWIRRALQHDNLARSEGGLVRPLHGLPGGGRGTCRSSSGAA